MSDTSPMDPAAILQRVDEIEAGAHAPGTADTRWLCIQLRTTLADTQKVAELKQTNGEIAAEFGRQVDALEMQLQVALADTRRVDYILDEGMIDGYGGIYTREVLDAAMAATPREET